jgi:hypothetical protein
MDFLSGNKIAILPLSTVKVEKGGNKKWHQKKTS